MRIPLLLLIASTAGCSAASAQSNWDKTYSITARPSLQVEVDDASVKVRSCGDCRSVRIHVEAHGDNLSMWKVVEMQGGNGIHFALKHRETRSFLGMGWHGQAPEVSVETPAETDLNLHSGDGGLQVAGLKGALDLKTGDGAIHTADTAGPLRVYTGDGSVQVQRAQGALNAGTGNGSMTLEGRFSQIDARTGDGSVQVVMLPGSVLQASSRVTTGDGSINMRVPRDLRADLQATAGDGAIHLDLPMQNSQNDRHSVRGTVNGGGPSLRLASGDGSISLSAF